MYTTPRRAITRRAGRHVRVRYDDGSDPTRAASVAHGADVAIVFASDSEGEYMDKRCPTVDCSLQALNSDQDGLIAKVAAANRRTIVVLETGDPVLTPWRGNVGAILEAWYPGEEGGTALARVLFGDADPGGRLPVTFPASADAYPTAGDPTAYPGGTDVFYREGVLVGYRWYDAHHVTPAFPFGFGLSYTRFAYDRLRITAPGRGPAVARVSLRVRNTGRRRGTDVPQLYLGLPEPSPTVVQPPRQLKGFRKVALAPGRSTRVTFAINARDLSWWDAAAGGWRIAPGCYGVMVGRSSRRIALHATVAVAGAACRGAAGRIALR